MAGFGETAALREGSERVKHHVFLKGDSRERFVVERSEATVCNRERPEDEQGRAAVKREGAAALKTHLGESRERAMGLKLG
jgi:hypothetical protein